jgi:hypothetical protein
MNGFLTEKELIKWVGERCTEQEAGCPICKAWTRHDLINHMRFEDMNTRIENERDDDEYHRLLMENNKP